MHKLTRSDLYSLENYAEIRPDMRARVMAHKKNRIVHVGPAVAMHFEDRLTIQYQVQEMLRVEKLFEAADIEDELAAYNPLIPDGSNWKATMMIQYPDVEERKRKLAILIGIENGAWVRVGNHGKVYAIANEDLARSTPEKTSSVHFMRFELSPEMVAAARQGASIAIGIDHDAYRHAVDPVDDDVRRSLVADLD